MSKDVVVYMASGWFNDKDDKILTELESYLELKNGINAYFPRKHGVKLKPGEIHQPGVRERVFMDNIHHIEVSDILIANLDGSYGQDTGTCYEVGYAMALGIPVIGYQKDYDGKMNEHLSSVVGGFYATCSGIEELNRVLDGLDISIKDNIEYEYVEGSKVLYIAPDNTQENVDRSTEVASLLVECFGKDFRWVDKLSNNNIHSCIDKLFTDVKFMVAVIDDRHPIVSWMMGQCFARRIPIISYTNYDYDVNIMLLCSILRHVKGTESMKDLAHTIKREGIKSIKKSDTSDIKAF